MAPSEFSCFGFCHRCHEVHGLPLGASLNYAKEVVMREFEELGRLDYLVSEEQYADPNLSLSKLLPGDRGHMFGVMECLDQESGETRWLRAFSSLGTGVRTIDGWVPYLISDQQFEQVILPVQKEIKQLTAMRNQLPEGDSQRIELETRRRELSRALMPRIHDLYYLKNFRGESQPLRTIYPRKNIPGGVGDCCAPKLLNAAIEQNLTPISCAEFFWGGSNRSGRKQPGEFFAACEDKCQPILGYMLCGL